MSDIVTTHDTRAEFTLLDDAKMYGTPRDPDTFPYAVILEVATDEGTPLVLRLSKDAAERLMVVVDKTLAEARRLTIEQDPDEAHDRRIEARF